MGPKAFLENKNDLSVYAERSIFMGSMSMVGVKAESNVGSEDAGSRCYLF